MPNFKNEKKKDNGNNTSTNTESVKTAGSKEYNEENKDYLSLLKSLCENNSQYKRKLRHILMTSSMEEAYKNTSFDDLLIISELMANYGRQYLSEHDLITLYILYVANVYTDDSFKSREYSFSQSLGHFSEEAIICVCNLFEKLGDSSLKIYIENMSYSFSITGILIKILLAYKEGKVISDLTPLGIFNITNAFYRNRSNFDKTETNALLLSVIEKSNFINLKESLYLISSDINLLRFVFNMFMFSKYRSTFIEFIQQLINTDDKFVLEFFLYLSKDNSLLNSFELKYFYNHIDVGVLKKVMSMYAFDLVPTKPKYMVMFHYYEKKYYYRQVKGRYNHYDYVPITCSIFRNASDFTKDCLLMNLMQNVVDYIIYPEDDIEIFKRCFSSERFEYFDVQLMKYFDRKSIAVDIRKDIDDRFTCLKNRFVNADWDNIKQSFSDAALNSPNILTTQALFNLFHSWGLPKNDFIEGILSSIFDGMIDKLGIIGFWNLTMSLLSLYKACNEDPQLLSKILGIDISDKNNSLDGALIIGILTSVGGLVLDHAIKPNLEIPKLEIPKFELPEFELPGTKKMNSNSVPKIETGTAKSNSTNHVAKDSDNHVAKDSDNHVAKDSGNETVDNVKEHDEKKRIDDTKNCLEENVFNTINYGINNVNLASSEKEQIRRIEAKEQEEENKES